MDGLFAGLMAVSDIWVIIWIFLGVLLGYVVGALPGLGKGTATAVAIPLTFYIEPLSSISFLIGISKGSTAGSAVSAILLDTPGEASSAPTALDGYPLARQGKAQKALKMGLFASVIGDFFSTVVLICLAAPLARYALLIGPVELTAILLFSMTFIAGLATGSMLKGLISAALGILVSTIGLETESAIPRFTFGMLDLYDGVSIIPIAVGMMAVAEMMRQIAQHFDDGPRKIEAAEIGSDDRGVTAEDWRRSAPAIARGTAIGTVVGILPGLGATVASFMSYAATQRASKDPSRFGHGAIEGVAAAESADNAVIPASFVPLFALGIPGNVVSAILIGAFVMHGVTPGPMIFTEQPALIYGIYAAMLIAGLCLLAIGYVGQGLFVRVLKLPFHFIAPVVLLLCCLGVYLQDFSLFSIWVMVAFGVIGFVMMKFGYSFVTFIIGFVLAPPFELALRQSIAISGGDWAMLLDHPIAIVFGALSLGMVAFFSLNSGPAPRRLRRPAGGSQRRLNAAQTDRQD